jgi:ABC-type polysaccharide/polyol phosphate export permease|tara:strand:- start:1135 stop:1905 length:771 start_codon:yes stop_codon:yes gene_type:complete
MLGKYLSEAKSMFGLGLQLSKVNFKLKNEGSFLGVFWYLLEPLLLFLILINLRVFFGNGIDEYALYLLIGLIMYNFFLGVSLKSTILILGNAQLIKSVKINFSSLIISNIMEGIYSHIFEIILFMVFMVYFKVQLLWILVYPLIFVFYVIFIMGVSFILATIGILINDLRNAWRVIARIMFFVTPIFYLIEKGTALYYVNLFNPLYYFITVSRELVVYGRVPSAFMINMVMFISLFTFLIGIIVFNKYKNKFAEMV